MIGNKETKIFTINMFSMHVDEYEELTERNQQPFFVYHCDESFLPERIMDRIIDWENSD